MAVWPQDPAWTPLEEINGGNQFNPADGLTFKDMNHIIANLQYMKKHGADSNTEVLQTTGTSTKATMSQKAITDLLYPFGSVVPQHKEGTVVHITDEIVSDKIEVAIDPEANASSWQLYKSNSNMFQPGNHAFENVWQNANGIKYIYTDSGVWTIDAEEATVSTWLYLSTYQNDACFIKAGHYMISLNMRSGLPSGWEAQFAAYVVDPISGERKYKHSFTWKGATATRGVGKYFAEDCYLQLRILVNVSNKSRVVISPQVNLGYELLPWEKPSRSVHFASNIREISTPTPGFTDFYMFATTSGDIEVDYQINMYSMLDTLKILQDVLTYLDNKVPTFYVHNAHIDAVNGAASAYAVEQFTADFTYYWPSTDAIEPTLAGFHDFVLNYQAGGLTCVGVAVVGGQTYIGNWVAADGNYLYFRSGTNQIAIAADDPNWDLTLSTDKFIKLT